MIQDLKERIAVMQAFSEGKDVQYLDFEGNWKDVLEPSWKPHILYRVKPSCILRPYTSVDEFLTASKEHGPWILSDGYYFTPVCIAPTGVCLYFVESGGINYYDWEHLLKHYTWQDGSNCGVIEN